MSPVQDERLGVLRLRTSLGRPRMRRCLRPQFRARVRAIREGCGFNTSAVSLVSPDARRQEAEPSSLLAPSLGDASCPPCLRAMGGLVKASTFIPARLFRPLFCGLLSCKHRMRMGE